MAGIEHPPRGFRVIRTGTTIGWVREGFDFLFDERGRWEREGRCDESSSALSPSREVRVPRYRGRGDVTRVPLDPSSGEHALVRHYRRGGMFRHVLGDRYPGASRFFQEARITEKARAIGIPTAEVLAVRAQTVGAGFYRGDLLTREIPGTEDLGEYLRRFLQSRSRPQGDLRRETLRSVADLVRQMHDQGLVHADLNVKNILLRFESGAVKAFVIDLDRARFEEPVSENQRVRNLQRLYRSLEKQGFLGPVVTAGDVLRFIREYGRQDAGLSERLADLYRQGSLSIWMHRSWWRLTGVTGRRREKGS